MNNNCPHLWIECTGTLRQVLKLSEYRTNEIDRLNFYVCSYCYHIKIEEQSINSKSSALSINSDKSYPK